MSEIELKFCVDAGQAAAVDAALRRVPGSKRATLESHYFDTDDRRLGAAGLALRLRKTGRLWEQTLKAPGESAVERHEETVPRPGRWGAEGPPLDPALHANTPAGEMLDKALAHGDSARGALRRVYTSVFTRRSVDVEAADARVEVAFDRGELRAGANRATILEVEIELKSGEARALAAFGRTGVIEHGFWLSTLSKAARGDRLACGEEHGVAVKAQAPRLDRAMPGPAILRAVMAACLDQVVANAGEIADGNRDDEMIHQLRVGLRRMRTAARELGRLCAGFERDWEAPVVTAFEALGEYRDRDTVAQSIEAQLSAAGSPEPSLPPAQAAAPDPVDAVRAKDFQCALLDVLRFTLDPADTLGPNDTPALDPRAALRRIGSRLTKLHALLKPSAKEFEQLD
ncbi:MAG TPA: CYTH and CHAD domain-containing protein, partial [Caldimonas sp.]